MAKPDQQHLRTTRSGPSPSKRRGWLATGLSATTMLLLSIATAPAKPIIPPLADMLRAADAVAIVEVHEVARVGGANIARATVKKSFRGLAEGQTVAIHAVVLHQQFRPRPSADQDRKRGQVRGDIF
jgi:hypothetical protein